MKKLLALLLVLLVACEKPSDCIESEGTIMTREVPVTAFTRIEVYRGIGVEITQGPEYKVVLQSGENFINNIQVVQDGNVLKIRDKSTCNWVREYGVAKVIITAPNLEEIYSKTEQDIRSVGTLNYPLLHIYANDAHGDGVPGAATGDFVLNVNTTEFTIENNNVSRFFITGQAQNASLIFWAGDGRIEAQNLEVQNMYVYSRGSNDMLVKPMQYIHGSIVSTGNVVLFHTPPTIDVQQTYQGQLLFN
ncbi:head GIN domain-containing protein [Flavobacterium sp. N1719]|uniref:head GIN domain-containing protein n=1 Tax=Flavobacterium sp. N1719 TaxID=2885633 RepID=UPI002221DE90|nr:head GIN domain-containing protein [Flavobacterium sp. N1719]